MRLEFAFAVALVCASSPLALCQEPAPISEIERAALLALYQSTDGSNWKNHDGWLGPPGSECKWFGVECTAVHQGVSALSLENNNLAGTLPAELNNLDLDTVRLAGNHLSGSLPKRILDQWQAGPLQLSGYAPQFTAQIEEIVIRRRTVVLCTDYEATVRPDGSVRVRSEKCRGSRGKPKVYCELKDGHSYFVAQNVDRLAWFMETSGFFELNEDYSRSMTHGGTFEIEVVRRGRRQKVRDFGAYGPQNLWTVERLILGILADAEWETVREARDCGFVVKDW